MSGHGRIYTLMRTHRARLLISLPKLSIYLCTLIQPLTPVEESLLCSATTKRILLLSYFANRYTIV
jgi:hypothetical protein